MPPEEIGQYVIDCDGNRITTTGGETSSWDTGSWPGAGEWSCVVYTVDTNGLFSAPSNSVQLSIDGPAGLSAPESFAVQLSENEHGTEPPPAMSSVFDPSDVPGTINTSDTNSVELGMKFRASVDGSVTGVRFYKGSLNTGTHVGSLWTAGGTLLAQVTFTNETASGWQEASFSSPVAITAGTVYVVSYFAPNGYYSSDSNYFSGSGVVNSPLEALQDGENGGNGVYAYGSGGFPDQTWQSSNYWVDVVFEADGADTTSAMLP